MGPAGDKGGAGAQGGAGMDGKTVSNGTSDPKKDEGKSGDFYINTNSYVLFGPKTDSGWGSGKSILGAKGDKGATGTKGDKGDTGDTGAQGAAEYVILSGSTDPSSTAGEQGDFYFNTKSRELFYCTGFFGKGRWAMIARLSNTQFSKIVDLPDLDYLDIMISICRGKCLEKAW